MHPNQVNKNIEHMFATAEMRFAKKALRVDFILKKKKKTFFVFTSTTVHTV